MSQKRKSDRRKSMSSAPAELDSGWTGWEAPTLLDIDFSNFGREDANTEESTTRQYRRSSIQQTPVDMIGDR